MYNGKEKKSSNMDGYKFHCGGCRWFHDLSIAADKYTITGTHPLSPSW
jgi:hypothetical protein